MRAVSLRRCASVFLVLLQAGLGAPLPVTGSPSSRELQSWRDLLERLEEKFQGGELEIAEDEPGDTGDPSYFDLADLEAPLSSQLKLQEGLHHPAIVDQRRTFMASPKRRRHFSGCFGTRLERIGTQTGLGCNTYKARSRRKSRS
ncbi:ventricular natriuretic peptide-like [Varanus komodoensis]|uniref:Uncharacterized protein n=1 Tax=Varanus komodoensis TaxID=61221 RepID=A0A8D2IQT9_VARKO|nr:ventricular natriuretic peptide-like [Varanus komodoensis]